MEDKILIVEDDTNLAQIAMDYLETQGLSCIYAEDSYRAEECLYENAVKLIILDINLPGMNGFSFCEKLREKTEVPVIFISARTSDTDKVNALMLGGDDYLEKPYSLVELYSRVVALLRRTYGYGKKGQIIFSDIEIDKSKQNVLKKGIVLDMTAKMYNLLLYMVQHPGEVLTKERLFTEIWGYASESSPSVLQVHIRWLRERIEDNPSAPLHILTVFGKGYCFEL